MVEVWRQKTSKIITRPERQDLYNVDETTLQKAAWQDHLKRTRKRRWERKSHSPTHFAVIRMAVTDKTYQWLENLLNHAASRTAVRPVPLVTDVIKRCKVLLLTNDAPCYRFGNISKVRLAGAPWNSTDTLQPLDTRNIYSCKPRCWWYQVKNTVQNLHIHTVHIDSIKVYLFTSWYTIELS